LATQRSCRNSGTYHYSGIRKAVPTKYARQVTASQFLDKLRDATASVAWSCTCEFAATSRYISETMQASAKVTIECEYEVLCS